MPRTRHLVATCARCDAKTSVTEVYWPATRVDPPDGENDPEECHACGEPWGDDTAWADDEPPDPW